MGALKKGPGLKFLKTQIADGTFFLMSEFGSCLRFRFGDFPLLHSSNSLHRSVHNAEEFEPLLKVFYRKSYFKPSTGKVGQNFRFWPNSLTLSVVR